MVYMLAHKGTPSGRYFGWDAFPLGKSVVVNIAFFRRGEKLKGAVSLYAFDGSLRTPFVGLDDLPPDKLKSWAEQAERIRKFMDLDNVKKGPPPPSP